MKITPNPDMFCNFKHFFAILFALHKKNKKIVFFQLVVIIGQRTIFRKKYQGFHFCTRKTAKF